MLAVAALPALLLSAPGAPAGAAAPRATAPAGFRLVDLGTLGGNVSEAHDINNRGTVVGESQLATGATHAFLSQLGHMRDLGTLNGTESFAEGINIHTMVVGFIFRADLGRTRAFRWRNGVMIDLGVLDPTSATDTRANAINDHGQIVGISGAPVGMHAVL